jgi:hypothetical protein
MFAMDSPSVVGGAIETLLVESFGPQCWGHTIKGVLSTVGTSVYMQRALPFGYFIEAKLSAGMVMCSWRTPHH